MFLKHQQESLTERPPSWLRWRSSWASGEQDGGGSDPCVKPALPVSPTVGTEEPQRRAGRKDVVSSAFSRAWSLNSK